MKRIEKIFTLFLALMFCFFGCKSNEDGSSKKIIATFEAEYDIEDQDPTFINFYDDKTWDCIVLLDGKRMFVMRGTYEGNLEKNGFVKFIFLKFYESDQEYDAENDYEYVRIKNGKFNLKGLDFIRQ